MINALTSSLLSNTPVMEYLQGRCVGLPEIMKYEVGLFTENQYVEYYNRLLFPIKDSRGNLLTYQGKALFDYKAEGRPKYWHGELPNKSECFFGLYEQLPEIIRTGIVAITEGPFDAIALSKCGIPTIAILGTAFREETYYCLRKYTKRFLLAMDNDEAGAKSTAKIMELLTGKECITKTIVPYGYKDFSELYTEKGKQGVAECLQG